MSERSLSHALYRSLATAWTPAHEGPPWAPWAWTLLINTLIGLILASVMTGRAAGLLSNIVISQGIGLSIHFLFWSLGRALKMEMFGLPTHVRLVYVTTVVMVGSWIGFTLGMLLLNRDPQLVMKILQRSWGGLITFPLISALVMIVMLTAVSRFRARQLAAERANSERIRADHEAIAARLALLNAQIEPHFLFNTLAHVRALVGRDARAAQGMIDSLIDYLRASSRNMAMTLVTLDDEIASVRGYLAVMQLRLGARLGVAWQVPAQAGKAAIPPAALQTLVENAIKHGIEPAAQGGEIRVEARAAGDRLGGRRLQYRGRVWRCGDRRSRRSWRHRPGQPARTPAPDAGPAGGADAGKPARRNPGCACTCPRPQRGPAVATF
jgi:signal transduction histidine kinase